VSSVEPADYANHLDSGEECVGELVVACGYCAEVFDYVEKPFDEIALAIQGEVRIPRLDAIGFRRNDRYDPTLIEGADQGISVIGFVSQECFGRDLVKQRLCLANVGGLTGRKR